MKHNHNLPNMLTMLRIIMVPLFIACFYLPVAQSAHIAAAVFILAYLTDILDGYLARKLNVITDFGKLMDPIADKLLSAAAIIMLTAEGTISPIPAIIIIAREFVVSGIRLVNAANGNVIAAGWAGKAKTLSQCIAIVLLIFSDIVTKYLGFNLGQIVLWVSVALAAWSAVDYIYRGRSAFAANKTEKEPNGE